MVIDSYCYIKQLKTKNQTPIKLSAPDNLGKCINDIFNNDNVLDDDDNLIDDIEANNDEDGIANNSNIVEMIHGNYNISNTDSTNDGAMSG